MSRWVGWTRRIGSLVADLMVRHADKQVTVTLAVAPVSDGEHYSLVDRGAQSTAVVEQTPMTRFNLARFRKIAHRHVERWEQGQYDSDVLSLYADGSFQSESSDKWNGAKQ